MARRKPSALPPAQSLALPVVPPRRLTADLRQLRALAHQHGPALLEGQRSDEVGLVLAHPASPWCPPEQADRGEVFMRVMTRAELREVAGTMRLPSSLGHCPVLLIGKRWWATTLLSPRAAARGRRRRPSTVPQAA